MTNFQKLFYDQKRFSLKTFGTAEERPFIGPLNHLRRECDEAIESGDISEFADIFLLLIDAFHRRFPIANADSMIKAAKNKLEINKKRKWGKMDSDGVSEHIKN